MTTTRNRLVRRARQRRRRRSSLLPLVLAAGGLISGLGLTILLILQQAGTLAPPLLEGPQSPTVLVLGVDRRPDESGPARSDTLILAGINPETGRAGLLSIPRDLYVPIPGIGAQRINTTLVFGYQAGDPGAGPRLAVATVEQQFRYPVDRYVVLDFQTFVRLVDALGDLEIDVPAPITDTAYPTPDYGTTTIHFDAGPQRLDGERALVYARTRNPDSDFGRSQRQQQVIRAIAARLANPTTWPRLPQFYQVLRAGVQTDIQPVDAVGVARLALALAGGDVETATLDGDRSTPWITPEGAYVQLPNWPAIDAVVVGLFGPR